MYQVTPIPAFNDNYIWALQGDDRRCAVVDPGDAAPVNAYLSAYDLELSAILITHHHGDHTGGAAALRAAHDVPVFGPAKSPYSGITHPLQDGAEIELLGQHLSVRCVPGHTLDHIAYLTSDQEQLFCGDTLFLGGCGRLFEGTAEQMLEAMRFFRGLPDSCALYCAHEYSLANLAFAQAVEPDNAAVARALEQCQRQRQRGAPTLPSRIGDERTFNPFLRYDHPAVIRAAQTHTGMQLASETETFQALREWKNTF